MSDTVHEEGELLKTRYHEYYRVTSSTPTSKKVVSGSSKKTARINVLLCENHEQLTWTDEINGNCQYCIKYHVIDKIDGGLLPTGEDVLSYLITKKAENTGKRVNNEYECAVTLALHWIHCNVYPMTIQGITKRITQMHENYKGLKKFEKKKKSETYWEKYNSFVLSQKALFDIIGDSQRINEQEQLWGVKMTDEDKEFYEDQKGSRNRYCSREVDPKWKASNERKLDRMNRSRNESYESSSFINDENDSYHEIFGGDSEEEDEYIPLPPSPKKTKYQYTEIFDDTDDFPAKYRYPRDGLRKVKMELYSVMHILKAKYHMSDEQIEGSIVTVANMLFGRKWKEYCPNQPINNNSLPSMSNTRRTERYAEAMTLSLIVEEMMNEDTKSCVVYSNDGSAQSGVGNYIVQSLTVNGIQRTLPTLPIVSESKKNLKDLIIATVSMLSASTGHRYSPSEIFSKIDFTMGDSTSHNLGVMNMVCDELQIDAVPPTLLCNVHPLMMFQSKVKQMCQQIHDSIGKKKIKDCFLVDVEFHNESFVIKAIKCLSSFINRECSSKPWNRSDHFEDFIKPKQNISISLKDHRFNRLSDCCLTLLYHLDDIAAYLEKYSSITNGISILDRSFVEMEILKPIFSSISLLGIHVTRPFHKLLMDPITNYTTLLNAYPRLYEELLTIPAEEVLQIQKQVFNFVSSNIYEQSLPDPCLIESLECSVNNHPNEISILVRILMKLFADGLHHQKGAIFGFGPSASEDTSQNVLKVSTVSSSMLSTLNENVQVHNIGEERNVGMINYELSIRGKENLQSASRKVVLNKSSDLMEKNQNFKRFRKQAQEIQEIRLKWTEKMESLRKIGYEEKDLINLKKDAAKLKDLEYLKAQTIPGPFTTTEEVDNFMEKVDESKQKNDRLYREVRYAKSTCLSISNPSSYFKLKKNGKNYDSEEYAACLKQYFDTSRNISKLTMPDLHNVLGGLQGVHFKDQPNEISEGGDKLIVGEHIIVVWIEGTSDTYNWHLAVVDSVFSDKIFASHLVLANKEKSSWVYPESADIHKVEEAQILLKNFHVTYHHSTRIRCSLSKDTINDIEKKLSLIN